MAIVSISVDPKHDTPEVLDTWAHKYGAGPGWHFLTGDTKTIYSLASDGFLLAVDPGPPPNVAATSPPIVHSSRFVLVDGEGRIRGYYDAFDKEALAQLVLHAEALAVEGQ